MQPRESSDLRHRRSRRLHITYTSTTVSIPSRDTSGGFLPISAGFALIAFFMISSKCLYIFETTVPNQVKIADSDAKTDRFIGERAELQLKRLTSLGTRVVGSYENEILAIDFFKREILFIEQELNKIHKIETDIQKPTGSYYLRFKPYAFRNYYANIQNFVVKLSSGDSNDSVLFNCHYDTVPESPGASDNGLNCVIMLEILRVLASSTTPLKNNVIFLFNGAEENPLQGSHGFITQQKWNKEVKIVINLDACGAGGREILFQTTGEPWLVELYKKVIPRPSAGVHAEELFKHGIIPSDTDFRNFRDFGNYTGYDIAHWVNGYVYHTKFDTVNFIAPGVYQNTGDNLLALVKELSQMDIATRRPRTRIVYFDIFSFFVIIYTESFAIKLNLASSILCLVTVYTIQKRTSGPCQSIVERLSIATGGQILCFVLSIAVVYAIAQILDILRATMSWYSHRWLLFPLYGFPIVVVQMLGLKITETYFKNDLLTHKIILFINGAQIFWTCILLLGTFAGVRSVYMLMIFILCPAIANLIVILSKRFYSERTFLIVNMSSLVLPVFYIIIQQLRAAGALIPMTARMGPHMNPEMVMGSIVLIFSAVYIALIVPYLLLLRKLKTFLFSLFLIHTITMFLVIHTDFGFPYSDNVRSPAPQRFYILHCERTFYDGKGLVRENDAGIFVVSLDRNDVNYVAKFVPELITAPTSADYCNTELFCAFPVFTSRFIKPAPYSRWIRASPPTIHHPTSLEIINQTEIQVNTSRIRILVTGPDHMTLGLSPRVGVELVKWSFDPATPPILDTWNGRNVYMIYYSHGLVGGTLEFDIDLEINQINLDYMMDIAVVGHYMHDKKFRTPEFKNFLLKFPKWAHLTPWTTTFKSWVI